MEFLIGGMAGTGAVLFTNPLDLIKTRFQLQGELQQRGKHAVYYKNVPHAAYVIFKNEGLFALQKGLVSAAYFQIMMNSLRLGLYNIAEKHRWNRNSQGDISLFKSAVCGAGSGVAGTLFGSPAYLVKTQIQSYSHSNSIAVGDQHGHQGSWHALKSIFKRGGIKGCFQGWNSAVFRGLVGSPTQLTSFAWSKDFLQKKGFCEGSPVLLAFWSSMLSGIATSIAQSPFDVIATRLYNQSDNKYKGVYDCIVKIYRTEGFLGYYKGVSSLYLRLAPHTTLSLVFWDKLKVIFDSYHQPNKVYSKIEDKI